VRNRLVVQTALPLVHNVVACSYGMAGNRYGPAPVEVTTDGAVAFGDAVAAVGVR